MSKTHVTYCRNCAANCGLLLEVDEGRIVSVTTDRQNEISHGYMCIKGQMSVDFHNGDERRLVDCLKRRSAGDLERIDALTAVDEIADRLSAIRAKHGARAIALYTGTPSFLDVVGKPLAKSFLAELGSPNLFSTLTIDQSGKFVASARMGAFATGIRPLPDTDVVLLAGNNPVVSHQGYPFSPVPMQNVNEHLRRAKAAGTKFIIIDPRRTETARYADLLIQPLPGHDSEIFACLIREVLAQGGQDRAFCDRYVQGLDALAAAVAPFTPELVAARAGVAAADLREAARLLAQAEHPACATGAAPSMAARSNLSEHLAQALNALLGGYARAGDLVRNPGVFAPKLDREMVVPPNRSWERGPKCRTADFGQLMGEFPTSLLPDEILAPGEGKIRALIVYAGNPVMALGDPEKTRKAFEDLELLVVLDPRMSETAKLAHYVLPPPLTYERADITSVSEFAFMQPFAQFAAPALDPPPGVISEDEFFWRLARRMGVQLILKKIPLGLDYHAVADGLSLDMATWPGREALLAKLWEGSRVSLETLKAHPHGVTLSLPEMRLKAPEADDGARLQLCPEDVAAELVEVAAETPTPVAPFLLGPRRLVEAFNSMYVGAGVTSRRHASNPLFIHPDDLADLSAAEGDWLQVVGKTGSLIARAKADRTMRRGVVTMAQLWGSGPADDPEGFGGHTGRLVSLDEDLQDICRMPLQGGIAVRIERVSEAAHAPQESVASA